MVEFFINFTLMKFVTMVMTGPSCMMVEKSIFVSVFSRGVGRGGAKGAAAPPQPKKKKRRERGERKRERKKKEESKEKGS